MQSPKQSFFARKSNALLLRFAGFGAAALFLAAGATVPEPAWAKEQTYTKNFVINGKTHAIRFPSNYCPLGNSPSEQAFLETARESLKPGIDLMYMAIECTELRDSLAGKQPYLNRYLQLQRVTLNGKNTVLRETREDYVKSAAGLLPKIDMKKMDDQVAKVYDELGMTMSGTQFRGLGHDGKATYYGLKLDVTSSTGTPRPLLALGAATLMNQVPMTINVYDGTQSKQSQKSMMAVMQTIIDSMTAHP